MPVHQNNSHALLLTVVPMQSPPPLPMHHARRPVQVCSSGALPCAVLPSARPPPERRTLSTARLAAQCSPDTLPTQPPLARGLKPLARSPALRSSHPDRTQTCGRHRSASGSSPAGRVPLGVGINHCKPTARDHLESLDFSSTSIGFTPVLMTSALNSDPAPLDSPLKH